MQISWNFYAKGCVVCVTSSPHNFIFSLISGKRAVNLFGEYVHVEVPCTPQDLQNLIMFLRTLHTYTTCPVHNFLKASVASNKNINILENYQALLW